MMSDLIYLLGLYICFVALSEPTSISLHMQFLWSDKENAIISAWHNPFVRRVDIWDALDISYGDSRMPAFKLFDKRIGFGRHGGNLCGTKKTLELIKEFQSKDEKELASKMLRYWYYGERSKSCSEAMYTIRSGIQDGASKISLVHPFLSQTELNKLGREKNLEELYLAGRNKARQKPISDQDLIGLNNLPNLRLLAISDTSIDGSLFAQPGFMKLKSLHLADCPLSEFGMSKINSLRSLEVLEISGSQVTANCMKLLSPSPHLKELYLQNTVLNDSNVEQLASLKQLKVLDISQTYISADGLFTLSKRLPDCKLLPNPKAVQAFYLYGKYPEWDNWRGL